MSKKSLLAAGVLAVFAALLAGVWYFTKPAPAEGEKELTIQVIHGDASIREFDITTSAEYLSEVLTETGIASGEDGPYGLYILTADGETADETAQQWWCITRGGEQLTTGASEAPVADGETYELTLKTGYDF